jgi:hypothetical protein
VTFFDLAAVAARLTVDLRLVAASADVEVIPLMRTANATGAIQKVGFLCTQLPQGN